MKNVRRSEIKIPTPSDLENNEQTIFNISGRYNAGVDILPNDLAVKTKSENKNWYVIRATHGRASKVYSALLSLNDDSIEPYFPIVKKIKYSNDDFNNPTQYLEDVPVDLNLLFVKCTYKKMRELVADDDRPMISGLTPYYNHCETMENGFNRYLIVPDKQMESFRIIVESCNEDIIIDQDDVPKTIVGDRVLVIGGPFAGVEGKILKFKHQKRVFVEIKNLGVFGTAYIPKHWIKKI